MDGPTPARTTRGPEADLALWNAAMRCQGQPLGLRDGVLAVVFDPLADPAPGGSWLVSGEGLSLRLEACDFMALAGAPQDAPLGMESLAALPEDLAAALTHAAAEMLARALELQTPLTEAPRPDPMPAQRLRVTVQRDGVALARLLACGSPAAMAGLIRGLGPMPGHPPAEIAALVPCDWQALSGGLSLRRAALEGLAPGDALLNGPGPTLCRIHAGGRVVQARTEETGWKIEALMSDDTPEDAPDLPDMPDMPEAEGPGDIPVRIDFRIARGQMTLAQLGELAPGGILPLEVDPPAPGDAVDILANGCKIGDGRLILIDDLPAVRISRLFGTGGHG